MRLAGSLTGRVGDFDRSFTIALGEILGRAGFFSAVVFFSAVCAIDGFEGASVAVPAAFDCDEKTLPFGVAGFVVRALSTPLGALSTPLGTLSTPLRALSALGVFSTLFRALGPLPVPLIGGRLALPLGRLLSDPSSMGFLIPCLAFP